jgi:cytochrome c oxidase subunit 2
MNSWITPYRPHIPWAFNFKYLIFIEKFFPFWSNLGFQPVNSNIILQTEYFHDHVLLVIVLIIGLLLVLNLDLLFNKISITNLAEYPVLEVWWTILPIFLLIFIAYPSLRLLYIIDEIEHPDITLRTLGHQWYWEYHYLDFPSVSFDSYIVNSPEINEIRLLDVDNRVVLPINSHTRVLVSSADVLHSWAIPSRGVKVDAVPGRLNQISLLSLGPSITYGQCSEICGRNHRFMPIVLEFVNKLSFMNWISLC